VILCAPSPPARPARRGVPDGRDPDACGGGDDSGTARPRKPTRQRRSRRRERGGGVEPDTWPLTGLPVEDGDSSVAKHPILVTKMDNTTSSSPQVGLSKADLVVEELVEGG